MPAMKVILDGDNAWPDLRDRRDKIHHVTETIQVAALEGGMKSGLPSVAIRIDLPDGKVVIAETSMQLFLSAAKAFSARFGELT